VFLKAEFGVLVEVVAPLDGFLDVFALHDRLQYTCFIQKGRPLRGGQM
jgi:hypothetical protein